MALEGMKILFSGIGFYDYEREIARELERRGAEVTLVNPSRQTLWWRLANKLKFRSLAQWLRRRLVMRLIEAHPNNDVVFVIKGEFLYQRELEALRRNNPRAEFKLYLWDSLERLDNAGELLAAFENVFSFDRVDCENNARLRFRPLFYRELPSPCAPEYDLSFVGWGHSDRLEILRSLREQIRARGGSYCLKLYMGRFQYIKERYLTRRLSAADEELIITRPMSYADFQRVTSSSRMVLDIAHPRQSGLTMRTIEVLASGCHLVTTNGDIVNYGDIPASSYTVVDRANIVLPQKFSQGDVLSERYSLQGFIDEMFPL